MAGSFLSHSSPHRGRYLHAGIHFTIGKECRQQNGSDVDSVALKTRFKVSLRARPQSLVP